MDWQEVGKRLLGVVPEATDLALALVPGGPYLKLAIKAVSSLLGVKSPDPQPADIMHALDDPKASDAVRLAMIQFNTDKMKAEYEEKDRARDDEIKALGLQLADVQSARQREVEITKATGRKDMFLFILAGFGIGIPATMVGWMLFVGFPKMDPATAALIGGFAGIIIGEYKTIFNYFFGSSKSSASKDVLLANSMPIQPKP